MKTTPHMRRERLGRWLRTTVAALALGLGASAAFAADRITIGALRFTSHAPSFIALERGYFAREGLDVELKFFQAAQPIAVAIASGDVDFGITALTGGFYSLADKDALRVVGGLYAEKPGVPGMAIMVSNKAYDEGVRGLADLKGRSWAMTQQGSSFHYVAGRIAEASGFALADMHLKPLQKVGSMIGAVKSGQIDAMAMVPHVAVPLEKSGGAKIIGWVRDLGPYQVTTIFTSAKNTAERPQIIERFMKAYASAIADYRAAMGDPTRDPQATAAVIDIIHKYVYPDQPREKAAAAIIAGAVHMNEAGALDLADVERQLGWFQAQGLAPKTLSIERFVDRRFAPIEGAR